MAKEKKKLNGLKPYKSYPFRGEDPILQKVRIVIDESDKSQKDINKDSGVSVTTVGNWKNRKTKRPQFATLNAVLRALGKTLVIEDK